MLERYRHLDLRHRFSGRISALRSRAPVERLLTSVEAAVRPATANDRYACGVPCISLLGGDLSTLLHRCIGASWRRIIRPRTPRWPQRSAYRADPCRVAVHRLLRLQYGAFAGKASSTRSSEATNRVRIDGRIAGSALSPPPSGLLPGFRAFSGLLAPQMPLERPSGRLVSVQMNVRTPSGSCRSMRGSGPPDGGEALSPRALCVSPCGSGLSPPTPLRQLPERVPPAAKSVPGRPGHVVPAAKSVPGASPRQAPPRRRPPAPLSPGPSAGDGGCGRASRSDGGANLSTTSASPPRRQIDLA